MKIIRLLFSTVILICISFYFTFSQQSLYTPLEFQKAYEKKTRSYDGLPGRNYWQNIASYDIQAEIIPELSMLKGQEQIKYFNNSPDTLYTITLQLHQDMYKKGNPRDRYIYPSDVTEGIILHNLRINDKVLDFRHNERIRRDNALLIIELDKPIHPGDSVLFALSWEFHIPEKTFIRFGKYDSTSFFIAYWYPRIAVYDDVFGWDKFGYDGDHELNNDNADYNVRINVPGNYYIWSTGELQNPNQVLSEEIIQKLNQAISGEELTHIIKVQDIEYPQEENEKTDWFFKATNVSDFAFGISDHHLWDAIPVTINNKKKVLINVVYHPDSKDYFKILPEFLKECLKYFSEKTPGVPYPYKAYTVFNGLRQGWHFGMEFPSFANNSYFTDDTLNFSMFAHELAHNYLPFYVNINQSQFSWMDEGITTYFEYEIMKYLLKEVKFDVWEPKHPLDLYSGTFFDIPVFTPSILYNRSANGYQTPYYRPSFAFIILEDILGKELFNKCLKEFILRWQGKRPIPHDLFNTFNDVSEENLNWFWEPWFFKFGYPDLAIEKVTDNQVTVKKVGNLPVPVYLRITYIDNTKEEIYKTAKVWKNGEEILEFKTTENKQIKMIKLSDRYKIPDVNRSNNIYIAEN
jgi:hypothetical protein